MNKISGLPFLLVMIISLTILPCCSRDQGGAREISPADAQKLISEQANSPAFVILDVRTPGEFASGHIANARNIDYQAGDFEAKVGLLDKNKSYLVYCQSGHRSLGAVSVLKDKGFKSINSLSGGLSRWLEESHPIVTR
ncbi:MAG: rhodanese-like domain-containing protein [Bacteroidota bacterium]